MSAFNGSYVSDFDAKTEMFEEKTQPGGELFNEGENSASADVVDLETDFTDPAEEITATEAEPQANEDFAAMEAPRKNRIGVNFDQKAKVIAVEDTFSYLAEEQDDFELPVPENEIEKIRQANEEFMEVEPSKSAINYENVFDGADLEYIITPTKLKESIIIREHREIYSYIFDVNFGDLIPVLQEDGSILLLDPAKNNEAAAVLEAPYMLDTSGAHSDAVTMELASWEDHFILTVTADAEWIDAEERVWPIMVDPTISTNSSQMNITYTLAQRNGGVYSYLPVNYFSDSSSSSWANITFPLAVLPAGANVKDAQLQTYFSSVGSHSSFYFTLYEGQKNPQIDPVWQVSSAHFGRNGYAVSTNEFIEIDITKAAQYWYNGSSGQGAVTMVVSGVSLAHIMLDEAWVTVSYTLNVGLNDAWSYETIDLGRSGKVQVNHQNGLLNYIHPTLQLDGNRIPIELSHNFISQRSDFADIRDYFLVAGGYLGNIFGMYNEHGRPATFMNIYDDGSLYMPDPDANGNTVSYNYEYLFGAQYLNIHMEDEYGNRKQIDTRGYSISRPAELLDAILRQCSSMGRVYNYSGVIRSMTDPAGREILFEYDFGEPIIYESFGERLEAYMYPAYISAIVDPAGRRIEFSYDLDDENQAGDSNGWFHIDYPDGDRTSYYFSGHEIIGGSENENKAYGRRIDYIKAADDSLLQVFYASDDEDDPLFHKVTGLEHWSAERSNDTREMMKKIEFDYTALGATVVRDVTVPAETTSKSYVSDFAGRILNVWNQDFVATYKQYNFEGVNPDSVSMISAAQPMINNLARNHSFEDNTNDWILESVGNHPGAAEIIGDYAYIGNSMMEISNPNQQISTSAAQTYTVNNTQQLMAGESYTLSAYVMLPEDLDTTTGGAKLTLSANGGLFQNVEASSEYITHADEWTRHSVTITIPDNWNSFTMKACLTLENVEDVAFFDAVQLEPGKSVNDYNLLENGQFDQADACWLGENLNQADGVQANQMVLTGETDIEKQICQTVTVNAKAGQTLVFNSMASANANPEGRFGIALDAGNDQIAYSSFSPLVNDMMQMTGGALWLEEDCETVTLTLIYENQIDTAYFGGAALYVGNFGESFDYYQDTGLLRSVKSDLGNMVEIEYDNNQNPNKIIQKFQDEILEEAEIFYDNYHNIIRTEIHDIVTEYFYDGTQDGSTTFGVVTEITSTADEISTTEYMTYTEDYNYLESYTDARGMTSYFEYDEITGQLLSATDPNGNISEYTYDDITGKLSAILGQAEENGPSIATTFGYTQDKLQSILRNNTAYDFETDDIGRTAAAKVGHISLVSNEYDAKQRLSQQNYANGDFYSPAYDNKDRVINETYDNFDSSQHNFSYAYNLKNQLSKLADGANGVTWSYNYDLAGRLANITGSDGTRAKLSHNSKIDKLNRLTVQQNGDTISDVEYEYEDDGRPLGATIHSIDETFLEYDFDGLNRLQGTNLEHYADASVLLSHSYEYLENGDGGPTDLVENLLIQTMVNGDDADSWQYTYDYDDNGNIISVNGDQLYTYDGLNRLIQEENHTLNQSVSYEYDEGGNILSKTTYDHDLETETVQVYTYGNLNWRDQLTSFDGNAITYDAMGNPLTYDGFTYAWQRGRQLAGISGNGLAANYKYNADGLRTEKTVDNVTTKFTWVNGMLMRQSDGTDTLDFFHDANGKALGFKHNGEDVYFYAHNLMGDVIAVIDAEGGIAAEYAYDAYGNIISAEGDIAELNPLRYRGYYYDAEIEMYYLQSRYYVPEWGRFLNADKLFIAGNALTAANMYAYCNGNPMMWVDVSGAKAEWVLADEFSVVNQWGSMLGLSEVGVPAGISVELMAVEPVLSVLSAPEQKVGSADDSSGGIDYSGLWFIQYIVQWFQNVLYWILFAFGFGIVKDPNLEYIRKSDTPNDLRMLAAVVYSEIGGGDASEIQAVAHSILNRRDDTYNIFPNNLSDVITTITPYVQYEGYWLNGAINARYARAMNYYTASGTSDSLEKNAMLNSLRESINAYHKRSDDSSRGAVSFQAKDTVPNMTYHNFIKANTPSDWAHDYWIHSGPCPASTCSCPTKTP